MPTRIDPTRVTALEHQLREHFGDPEDFGLRLPLPEGVMGAAGKLVLAIVGADGGVSAVERQAFGDLLRSYGAPPQEIAEVERFDPRTAPLESLVNDTTRRLATALVYDSIRVARADGFQEKERQATMRAAKALGLDPALVQAFEAQVLLDEAVLEARALLLQVPQEHTAAARGPLVAEGRQTRGAQYGTAAPAPRELFRRISQAILVVASADGALTEKELAWHVGQGRSVGMPDDLVQETLKFDPVGQRIEDHVDATLMPYARLIVFDALRAAHADGLHQKEEAMAKRAAKALHLGDVFVRAALNQLHVEAAVRQARLTLLRRS